MTDKDRATLLGLNPHLSLGLIPQAQGGDKAAKRKANRMKTIAFIYNAGTRIELVLDPRWWDRGRHWILAHNGQILDARNRLDAEQADEWLRDAKVENIE